MKIILAVGLIFTLSFLGGVAAANWAMVDISQQVNARIAK